jgi:hypothetical protein
MSLRPYQHLMVDHIARHPRSGLFVPMGMGKTLATLTALDALTLVDDPFPALVLAPLRVAKSVWPTEVEKWASLRHLRVSKIVGATWERAAALSERAEVFTMNYENLQWLAAKLDGAWPFRTVIADESTRLKGFRLRQGGERARALGRFVHRSPRYIGLTGTPAPNGLQDLWGQAWMIDRGERLGRSFEAFKARWFQVVQVGEDRFETQLVPLPHAQREIQERLADVCLSLDAKDWFDVRDPIMNTIEVELPPKARALYKQMEREMFIEIAEHGIIEAFSASSKMMKCFQLANGAIYTDEKCSKWESVHDAKIEALESVVEEAGGPVLVAYHFRHDLARLLRAFPKARALDADPRTVVDWNAGRIPILCAHPASAGHGLSLQDGGNTALVGLGAVPANNRAYRPRAPTAGRARSARVRPPHRREGHGGQPRDEAARDEAQRAGHSDGGVEWKSLRTSGA